MKNFTNLALISLCLFFVNPALASNTDSNSKTQKERVYDKKFRRNYNKYKKFSSSKKQRMQRLHKSVNGLTDEQKRKLRERLLNKKHD